MKTIFLTTYPDGSRRNRLAGLNVDDWVAHEPNNEWETMMKKVAKFHHKHDFAGKNGHDMGYRIALTVEELGNFLLR